MGVICHPQYPPVIALLLQSMASCANLSKFRFLISTFETGAGSFLSFNLCHELKLLTVADSQSAGSLKISEYNISFMHVIAIYFASCKMSPWFPRLNVLV